MIDRRVLTLHAEANGFGHDDACGFATALDTMAMISERSGLPHADVARAFTNLPPNLFTLLDSPHGISVLATMVSAMLGGICDEAHFDPTIH